MKGPDFIGIGAQKAGTGWLAKACREHPGIWLPPVKELHYFDRDRRYPSPSIAVYDSPLRRMLYKNPRKRMRQGFGRIRRALLGGNISDARWLSRFYLHPSNDDWYRGLFQQQGRISGEITPAYMMLDEPDIKSTYEAVPHSRIVIVLRNPIERAWSQVRFTFLRGGTTELPDMDTLLDFIESPAQTMRGSYSHPLRLWRKHFGAENVLVLFTDHIRSKPSDVCRSFYDFVGASEHSPHEDFLRSTVNPSPQVNLPQNLYRHLSALYLPELTKLAEAFPDPCAKWLIDAQASCPTLHRPAHCSRAISPGNKIWTTKLNTHKKSAFKKEPLSNKGRSGVERALYDKHHHVVMDFSAKSGCTIAVKMFFAHMGLLEEAMTHSPWVHDYRREHFYKTHPCQTGDLLSGKNVLFKVVRNPYTRIVSSLRQKVRTGKNTQRITSFLGLSDIRDITFRQFVSYLESIDLRVHCDSHYRHQLQDYELQGLRQPLICRIETIKEDIATLNTRFGFAFEPSSFGSDHHVKTDDSRSDFAGDMTWSRFDEDLASLPDYHLFYDRDIYERVTRLYELDLRQYQYSFPWSMPIY